MDYLVFAGTLIRGFRTAQSLAQLINGSLAPTLNAVGDIHFKAAAQALKDMQISTQPGRELGIAIGHLGAAHQAFDGIQYPSVYGDEYPKCIGALSTIATCYRYSGDFTLMHQYLDLGEQTMLGWCSACRWLYNNGARWERGVEDGGWLGRMLGLKPYNMHREYMARHDAAHGAWNQFKAACRAT